MKKNILQIFIIGCLFIGQLVFAQPESNTITGLPGEPAFIEPDFARDTIYVSVPDANQVLLFSSQTLQITNTITFTGNPYGLDLSNDGNTLYVGLSGTGTVAFVDLTDPLLNYIEIDVSNILSQDAGVSYTDVYNVYELNGEKVFVSGNFGNPNLAYIDLTNQNSLSKAGYDPSNSEFRTITKALLQASPDGEFLYAHQNNASPGSLYKLDINQENIPIILEDKHGDITAAYNFANKIDISSTGDELYLTNGQIISTDTLTELFVSKSGFSSVSLNSTEEYIYGINFFVDSLKSYSNTITPSLVGETSPLTCNDGFINNIDLKSFINDEQDQGWYLVIENLNQYKICYIDATDTDSDGAHDLRDNCSDLPNPNQNNSDNDHLGDLCDPDDDNDGLDDDNDPFPLNSDGDNDGVSDFYDDFPSLDAASVDTDGDGQPDQFHPNCDLVCQQSSGLVEDFDDDDDDIPDVTDPQPLIPDPGPNPSSPDELTIVDIAEEVAFIEIDEPRFLAYVTIPKSNELLFISLKTLEIVYTIEFVGEPQGLDLSDDGNTLYVGLSGTGSVAFVDLTDPLLSYIEIDVSQQLNYRNGQSETRVFDVLEAFGTKVFVTGNPGSYGLSNLVVIDKQDSNSVSEAGINMRYYGNPQSLRDSPRLVLDSNSSYLYVHNDGDVFQIDLSVNDYPIVKQSEMGLGITRPNLNINSDNSNLILGNGKVVSIETLMPKFQRMPVQAMSLSSRKDILSGLNDSENFIDTYDVDGFYKTGSTNALLCGNDIHPFFSGFDSTHVYFLPDSKGWLLTVAEDDQSRLCYIPKLDDHAEGFPKPDASLNPEDYFPLTDNLQWSYITDPSINTGFNSSVLSGTVMVNGEATKRINISTGETEYYSVSQAGVKLHRSADSELTVTYSPPLPMTPSNLAVGTSVTQSGTATSVEPGEPNLILDIEVTTQVENYEIVTLPENKEVEAFKIKQTQTYSFQGSQVGQIVQYYWYAKNIGLIKAHLERAPDNEISELVSTNDFDSDTIPDNIDPDDDNDGTPDTQDAFPFDPTESSDNDGDGTGDNADLDDDNDGVLDVDDNCPLVNNPGQMDSNIDGEGDACDSDDTDGDGVPDKDDAFPLDPTESSDNDGDGIGDNADLDDDNDQVDDEQDNCPLIANTDQLDQNQNGIGDVCEAINDCDFFVIGKITICL